MSIIENPPSLKSIAGASPGEPAPAPAKSSSRFYRPELDALRFMAFLLVFFRHVYQGVAPQAAGFSILGKAAVYVASGGQFGVDLFFILSAYLITELLTREKMISGALDVSGFYVRRILRIWPLYFTFVAFCFVLQRFTPAEAAFPFKALLYFLLLGGNWYCTGGMLKSPVGPLWSVSIEEQFYLLWPLVIRRASRTGIIGISIFLIVFATMARWLLLEHSATWEFIWCSTFTRVDTIGLGALIAVLLRGRMPRIIAPLRLVLFGAGLVLLGLSGAHTTPSVAGRMMCCASGILAGAALFFSFLGAPQDGFGFLAARPLVYLGRISYGLYVVHMLALDAAKMILIKFTGVCAPGMRLLLAMPVTIVLAAISYRWLESPFLRMKKRFTHITCAE